MARTPKLWFWESRKIWCVYINGKKHLLGPNKKAATTKFHNLMGQPEATQPMGSVAVLLDAFLTWTEQNRSAKTFRGYKDYCDSFDEMYPTLDLAELTAAHVTDWLNEQETWNTTTKHGAVTCLKRAFNWAMKNKGLKANPLALMEKPKAKTRTQIITLEEFKAILKETPDRSFRNLLRFCWETGSRPFEAKLLEARHIDLKKSRCVIPAAEGKKERLRVIYLPAKAAVIVRRLLKDRPKGKLFLNRRGRAWTASAVKCRFAKLEEKLGKRFFNYMFRHTWITRKLRAGVDSHVVAALSGHSDTKMLDKVYSHVAEDHEFMLAEASK